MGHNHRRVLAASILSTGASCDHRPEPSLLVANTQWKGASCGGTWLAGECELFLVWKCLRAVIWCSLLVREIIIFN